MISHRETHLPLASLKRAAWSSTAALVPLFQARIDRLFEISHENEADLRKWNERPPPNLWVSRSFWEERQGPSLSCESRRNAPKRLKYRAGNASFPARFSPSTCTRKGLTLIGNEPASQSRSLSVSTQAVLKRFCSKISSDLCSHLGFSPPDQYNQNIRRTIDLYHPFFTVTNLTGVPNG